MRSGEALEMVGTKKKKKKKKMQNEDPHVQCMIGDGGVV